MRGETLLASRFQAAQTFWDNFFVQYDGLSDDELAKQLSDSQFSYERLFDGERSIAKETMALTAIASLYDEQEGFADNQERARRLAKAFLLSSTSLEVKSYARRVIAAYHLDEDDPEMKRLMGRH